MTQLEYTDSGAVVSSLPLRVALARTYGAEFAAGQMADAAEAYERVLDAVAATCPLARTVVAARPAAATTPTTPSDPLPASRLPPSGFLPPGAIPAAPPRPASAPPPSTPPPAASARRGEAAATALHEALAVDTLAVGSCPRCGLDVPSRPARSWVYAASVAALCGAAAAVRGTEARGVGVPVEPTLRAANRVATPCAACGARVPTTTIATSIPSVLTLSLAWPAAAAPSADTLRAVIAQIPARCDVASLFDAVAASRPPPPGGGGGGGALLRGVVAFRAAHYVACVYRGCSGGWHVADDARVFFAARAWPGVAAWLLQERWQPLLLFYDTVCVAQ